MPTIRAAAATLCILLLPCLHAASCPQGWTANEHSCYLLVKGGGTGLDEAVADCSTRNSKASLVWFETQSEMQWVFDTAKSRWGLREDWGQCSGCGSDPTAWIGLQRQSGEWRWRADGTAPPFKLNWFIGHPRPSPNDFASMYESPSNAMYIRSEKATGKMWHLCKFQFTENTATDPPTTTVTTMPPPTTPSPITTTTSAYDGSCPSRDWTENGDFCYLLVKGSSGRTFDEAMSDCKQRYSSAELLWVTSDSEMQWLTDYSSRNWGIKRDWRDCTNCASVEAVWIGLYRDTSDGQWKWRRDNGVPTMRINWFFGEPKDSPNDFAVLFDTGSQLRFRSRSTGSRQWHMCKVQHRVPTGTTAALPTTTTPRYDGPCPSRDWTANEHSCYLLVKGGGTGLDEAVADCSTRNSKASLVWFETQSEMQWVFDTAKSRWGLREDWGQCSGCGSDPTAWIGLQRQSGEWRWQISGKVLTFEPRWFPGHPRASPRDFASMYESPLNTIYLLSVVATPKMWHVCKFQFSQNTATDPPTTTATTVPPTTNTPTPTTTPYTGSCPSADWVQFQHACYLLVKGANGNTYSSARRDCLQRSQNADLMWVSSETEMSWLRSYQWHIWRDWLQCSDCTKIQAAWFGFYRDTTAPTGDVFRWVHDVSVVQVNFNWWPKEPRPTPKDYGIIYDTGSQLRFRTYESNGKFWHFCKKEIGESSASTPLPTFSTAPPTRYPPGPCATTDWTDFGDSCYMLAKGTRGLGWSQASEDCRRQHSHADLLWLSSAEELRWFADYSRRAWNIKKDYQQCEDCRPRVEGAWIGLFRDRDGVFKWSHNSEAVSFDNVPTWFPGNPKNKPADSGLIYDTGSRLRLRTELLTDKFWYFCKYNYKQVTRTSTPTADTGVTATTDSGQQQPCPQGWAHLGGSCYSLRKDSDGSSWSEARSRCQSLDSSSDLLWIDSAEELNWLVDYSARRWNIRREWSSCVDCDRGIQGAWVGLRRVQQQGGLLKWVVTNRDVGFVPNWWFGNPKPSPSDYALLYDTGSQLRMRTEEGSKKFWYFCKTAGKFPSTVQPQVSGWSRFWNSGGGHMFWILPLLIAIAIGGVFGWRQLRNGGFSAFARTESKRVLHTENPVFSAYASINGADADGDRGATIELNEAEVSLS